jgi:hypothetical protein
VAAIIPGVLAIPYAILGAISNNSDTIVLIYSLCYSCFSLLYGVLIAFAVPASYGILAATDQLGDALNPSKILGLVRAAPAPYVMAIIGGLVASLIGNLGTILCGIGVLATMAYSVAIMGHLYGQAYQQAISSTV